VPSLVLNDSELQTATCRVAAHQARQDAAAQSNPEVKQSFNAIAKRFSDLAAKLSSASGQCRS
jgi:hypothetical protein